LQVIYYMSYIFASVPHQRLQRYSKLTAYGRRAVECWQMRKLSDHLPSDMIKQTHLSQTYRQTNLKSTASWSETDSTSAPRHANTLHGCKSQTHYIYNLLDGRSIKTRSVHLQHPKHQQSDNIKIELHLQYQDSQTSCRKQQQQQQQRPFNGL